MKTDVLIVGGGIAGVALAHYLTQAGVDVILAERGALNREASGTNAGSMHLQIAIHQLMHGMDDPAEAERLQRETRLAAAAMELWRELDAELDLDWHTTGGLMVAETPAQVQLLHDKKRLEEEAGLETHVLEGDELRRFAPYLSERVIGATARFISRIGPGGTRSAASHSWKSSISSRRSQAASTRAANARSLRYQRRSVPRAGPPGSRL